MRFPWKALIQRWKGAFGNNGYLFSQIPFDYRVDDGPFWVKNSFALYGSDFFERLFAQWLSNLRQGRSLCV